MIGIGHAQHLRFCLFRASNIRKKQPLDPTNSCPWRERFPKLKAPQRATAQERTKWPSMYVVGHVTFVWKNVFHFLNISFEANHAFNGQIKAAHPRIPQRTEPCQPAPRFWAVLQKWRCCPSSMPGMWRSPGSRRHGEPTQSHMVMSQNGTTSNMVNESFELSTQDYPHIYILLLFFLCIVYCSLFYLYIYIFFYISIFLSFCKQATVQRLLGVPQEKNNGNVSEAGCPQLPNLTVFTDDSRAWSIPVF